MNNSAETPTQCVSCLFLPCAVARTYTGRGRNGYLQSSYVTFWKSYLSTAELTASGGFLSLCSDLPLRFYVIHWIGFLPGSRKSLLELNQAVVSTLHAVFSLHMLTSCPTCQIIGPLKARALSSPMIFTLLVFNDYDIDLKAIGSSILNSLPWRPQPYGVLCCPRQTADSCSPIATGSVCLCT